LFATEVGGPCQPTRSDSLDISLDQVLDHSQVGEFADPRASMGKSVKLSFDINRDGTPSNIRVETSSGSPSLDLSAMHALQRIDTFGPLPTGNKQTIEDTFTYRPNGSTPAANVGNGSVPRADPKQTLDTTASAAPIERRELPAQTTGFGWITKPNGDEALTGPNGTCATILTGVPRDERIYLKFSDGTTKIFGSEQMQEAMAAAGTYCRAQ
jgi:TonB family protein